MKHSKNADTLLFLVSFTISVNVNKILDEHSLWVQPLKKGWETAGSGATLPQYLPNLKN